eukprot:gene2159-1328_t
MNNKKTTTTTKTNKEGELLRQSCFTTLAGEGVEVMEMVQLTKKKRERERERNYTITYLVMAYH